MTVELRAADGALLAVMEMAEDSPGSYSGRIVDDGLPAGLRTRLLEVVELVNDQCFPAAEERWEQLNALGLTAIIDGREHPIQDPGINENELIFFDPAKGD